MIGLFFDTVILVSADIEWFSNDPSNSKSWKVLETVSSHLNMPLKTGLKRAKLSYNQLPLKQNLNKNLL